MLLIDCEINLTITWSANLIICEAERVTAFAITHTKVYVPSVNSRQYKAIGPIEIRVQKNNQLD